MALHASSIAIGTAGSDTVAISGTGISAGDEVVHYLVLPGGTGSETFSTIPSGYTQFASTF
jgi:hypothetical protein